MTIPSSFHTVLQHESAQRPYQCYISEWRTSVGSDASILLVDNLKKKNTNFLFLKPSMSLSWNQDSILKSLGCKFSYYQEQPPPPTLFIVSFTFLSSRCLCPLSPEPSLRAPPPPTILLSTDTTPSCRMADIGTQQHLSFTQEDRKPRTVSWY